MSWLLGTSNTSFWDDLTSLPANAFTGELTASQKQDVLQAGQAQIQSVVDNVKQYYTDVTAAQVATDQAYADAQKAAYAKDVGTLTKGVCPEGQLNLDGVGLGCQSFGDLFKYAAVFAIAIAIIYVFAVFGPALRQFRD